jgi:hypothetical protein
MVIILSLLLIEGHILLVLLHTVSNRLLPLQRLTVPPHHPLPLPAFLPLPLPVKV